jgi:hypothetical protein
MCISHIVARQRLGKHVSAATNTHATIGGLFDAVFSMRSVHSMCSEKKGGD